MPARFLPSADQLEEIRERYAEGESIARVARAIDVGEGSLKEAMKRAGIVLRSKPIRRSHGPHGPQRYKMASPAKWRPGPLPVAKSDWMQPLTREQLMRGRA